MLLESVEYTRPGTVDEALEALSSNDAAAPLAGGQSLINVLKNRVASIDLLVDISRLEELRSISVDADGTLEVGACVTYDELDRSPDVRAGHDLLATVAGRIAGGAGGRGPPADPPGGHGGGAARRIRHRRERERGERGDRRQRAGAG